MCAVVSIEEAAYYHFLSGSAFLVAVVSKLRKLRFVFAIGLIVSRKFLNVTSSHAFLCVLYIFEFPWDLTLSSNPSTTSLRLLWLTFQIFLFVVCTFVSLPFLEQVSTALFLLYFTLHQLTPPNILFLFICIFVHTALPSHLLNVVSKILLCLSNIFLQLMFCKHAVALS